jgi:hypothetical protein
VSKKWTLESTSKSIVVLICEKDAQYYSSAAEEYQYEFYKEGFYMEVNNFGEILTIKKIS